MDSDLATSLVGKEVALTPGQRDAVAALCRRVGVLRLDLFGSRARGDARPDSDFDFLATVPPGFGDGKWSPLEDARREMSRVLGARVDLLLWEGMSRVQKERVSRELVTVYEE